MSDTINYGNLMHNAMRRLIQQVLEDVARNGLPGQHHFFITFDTRHPDVQMADWLSDRYPEEMTIVIQHWFDNLTVTDAGFAITLNFGDQPEPLYIPYDAIQTFVDPSVEFGLRFETHEDGENDGSAESPHPDPDRLHALADAPDTAQEAPMQENAEEEPPATEAEVVSLDNFRK